MLVFPKSSGGNTKQIKLKNKQPDYNIFGFYWWNPGYILNKRGFDLVILLGISDVSLTKEDKLATLSISDVLRRTFYFIVHDLCYIGKLLDFCFI